LALQSHFLAAPVHRFRRDGSAMEAQVAHRGSERELQTSMS
jgi:hypothetical protein